MNYTLNLKRSRLKFSKFLTRVNNSGECDLSIPGNPALGYNIMRFPAGIYGDRQFWSLSVDQRVIWEAWIHLYKDREYYEKIMDEPDKHRFIMQVMNMGTELLLRDL